MPSLHSWGGMGDGSRWKGVDLMISGKSRKSSKGQCGKWREDNRLGLKKKKKRQPITSLESLAPVSLKAVLEEAFPGQLWSVTDIV